MEQPHGFNTRPLEEPRERTVPLREFSESDIVPWVMEFRIVGTPYIVRVPTGRILMIGRGDTRDGYVPDVDLSEYNAHAQGISRRHARIHAQDNRVTVEDNNAPNGTYVNNVRIEAGARVRLNHGDLLTLGQFELQVNFIVKPMIDDHTRIGVNEIVPIPKVTDGTTMLVVDENEDVMRLVGYYARQSGYVVTAVATLEDAISQIDTHLPDTIITEMMFEVGSGLDLLRYVRALPAGDRTLILVMTTTGNYTMGQALTSGADLLVGKPLAMEEFVGALGKLSELRAERA